MKKVFLFCLCVALCMNFVACSCKNSNNPINSSESFSASGDAVTSRQQSDNNSSGSSSLPGSSAASSNASATSSKSSAVVPSQAPPPKPQSSSAPAPEPSDIPIPSHDEPPWEGICITGSNEYCQSGDNVTVTFSITADSNAAAANFDVKYKGSAFQYVSYKTGPALSGTMGAGNNADNGLFKYGFVSLSGIYEPGALFSITFTAGQKGTYSFDLTVTSLVDCDSNPLPCKIYSATVTVK